MANKEEVIFKVKAELAGFKKSMEDLKKIAKDSSKNIEKAMNMDLTDEGSKAGKSFAKGMNKELRAVTNTLRNELKIMSEKTYNIKIKLDSSSVERVKRDLSNIEIRVSASASGRASSSMSNNANAPNSINSIMSATNSSALLRLTDAVNKATNTINSIDKKANSATTKTESTKIKIDPVEVNVDFATERLEISAKNMANTISEAMNNSIDSIKKAFESSANEIRKAIEATNKKPVGVVENVKRRTSPQQTEDLELSKAMIKKYEEEILSLIELIAQLKALRKVRKNIESGTVGYKYVNDEIAKTESAIAKVNSKIKEYKNYLGDNADNLSISFNRTNESINQLRMNLQWLANNQGGSFSKLKDSIKNAFSGIESSTSQVISKAKTLFSVFGQQNSHVATHFVGQFTDKMNQLKDTMKKVSASVKDIGTPIKKAFNGVSGIINKIISPIKKVTSGFKNMGNEAKTASGKVNGLTGSFKGLLGKLTMFFGVYEIFNLFKEGTKDAMQYEASIVNLQLTYGKASQSLIDFANKHAIAFGLSKRQVAEYGNIYSAIMRDVNREMNPSASADAIAKQTMGMSQEILKSAGIISSALGYDMEYVLEGLRSGILGSSQAVDQFGLNLKRANLENSKAFKEVANGVDSWEKLTVAQQQYIIAQEIVNQTTSKFGSILDKNGNIMKTTASLHTQFLAQWANTKLAIGNLGKVIWTAVVGPLTKVLAVMEMIFNYAAGALTAILESLGIKVDLAANLGGSKELENNLGGLDDTASDTSDAIDGVGDSAQDTAKDTEDAAKKIKRALAGFDQINVLTLGDDDEDNEIETPELGDWNPTPLDPGEFGVDIPEFTADTSGLEELLDKMKAIFKEFLEPFKAAWDELGDRWIAAWDRLKDSFKNFCDALSDFLVSVWNNGGKEFVQHMAEIALAVGIAAMEIGGTILDSLAKLWKHLDPSTNINTKGLLDALNEVSVKIRDLLLDLNGHFESLMNNGGQDVLNALGDMFMNLGEAAVRGVGVVIDAIDGLLDHLDPATNKKTQGALGGLEYLFKSIGQFALGLTDAFATFMDNGGQEFLNNMGDIVMILIDLGATIAGDLLNAITAFFDSFAGHALITIVARTLELLSSILKGLLEILEPLTPIISGVVAAIGAFMVASKITTAVTTIVSAFQNLGPILGIVKAGLSALWAVLAANPVAALVAAIVGIGVLLVALYNKCEGFREVVDNILGAFSGLFDALKETFSNILEDVTNIFQDVIDIIVGIFTGDGEKVGEAVRSLVGNILDLLWDLVTGVVDIGWNLITGLVEGIWEGIKALPQLLAGIAEFIFDFFVGLFGLSPETAEKIKQIGRDIIDGICEGVMGAINAIGDFFGAIGDAIKQGIDNITSAEWWSDLGKAIAQPFIDAKDFIVELLGDIGSSISEWWEGVKDFFSGVASSISETLGDFVQDVSEKWNNIKDTVSERVSIATKNASEKWGELTEELSGMLDDFIERNKERWERIKQDTAKKLEPIANEVIDKYTNMKDETCKALDDLMAKSEEAWAEVKEKIKEKLEPVVEYISGVWNRTKDAVVGAWEEITTNVSEAWDRFKDACMEVWDGIVEYVSGVWDRTKEAWIGAWNEIKEECAAAWDRVSEECIETWNETCEYLNGVWSRTKEAWIGAWNEIKEECTAAWDRVSEECINIWNNVTEYLEGVWNRTRDAWIGAWEEIKTECVAAWDRFSSECIDIWNNAYDYVSGVWNRTKEAWIDAWNTIKEECTAAWDRVSSECIDMWNNACDYLNGVWNRTKDAWIDAWSVIKEECGASWSRVSEECKDMWDNTCEYISGVWNRTKDAWIDAWNVIKQECSAAWDRVSEECKRIWDNTCDYLGGVWYRTKDAWIDAWNVIVEEVKAAWDRFSEECANIFENIGSKITGALLIIPGMIKDLFNFDIFEPIKNSLETGLDKLKDGAGLVEKAYSIGKFIIEGLFDGIKTTVEGIGTFFSGVYDIVIGFFKDIFGIHSPSTVFAELGGYLIEGLIQGISDSVPSLVDIFNGVSDAISGAWDKVEKAWDGASDFFNGIGETVKGVLDTIKNTSIPKPKIEWDKVKESASKIVDNIKTTVEKFKADLPKPKVSWNDLTTSLSKILDNLKRTISNFKWELPKPKLPKFSVTGGQAPWGFMGKGSMPKIDIKWFKTGGIMTSATLFGMSGNTLLGGGEAGAEAILPLDELWSRLDDHFNQQNALLRSTVANSNGNNSNRPVNIVLKVNDIEMGKAVVSSLKALSNHSGTLDLPLR